MEPPPPPLSSTTVVPATTTNVSPPHVTSSYPESLESSTTDASDDLPTTAASSKLRLMCSYGGQIIPRPHDKSLFYTGGDTRLVVVDRNSSLSSLIARLSAALLKNNRSFTLKYQLPNEDLDSLISVTTDEDLENMIEEYDRTIAAADSAKSSRLRLFLFTEKPEGTQSLGGRILESSVKSDDWFLDALNNAGLTISRGFSDSVTNNLDSSAENGGVSVKSGKQQLIEQHVADTPALDTSSFESASSSPTLANLPPIRVRAEEAGGVKGMHDQIQKLGIEEQFARFNVGSKQQELQREDGFAAISSSPPPMPVSISLPGAPVNATTASSEFNDERTDQGVVAGFRKPPTPHSLPQNLPPQQGHHVKSNSGGHELPSPNSVASDNSTVYQEPMSQFPSGSTVVAGNGMINQNQEPGWILQPQQSAQSQQQQFIHAAAAPQYIHHHPSNGHPVQTYIKVYPSQLQPSFHMHPGHPDQPPYPLYYVAAPVPPGPYGMHVPQSGSVNEAPGSLPSNHPQAPPNNPMMAQPPNSHLRSVAPGRGGKPESGVMSGAQMVHQIPTNQQQFMGYSQIHLPPQSGVPNYGYEHGDNAHKQMYYTLPIGHAQYQTMTGPPPAMVLPDGSTSAKLPAENMSQQIPSSQPL